MHVGVMEVRSNVWVVGWVGVVTVTMVVVVTVVTMGGGGECEGDCGGVVMMVMVRMAETMTRNKIVRMRILIIIMM